MRSWWSEDPEEVLLPSEVCVDVWPSFWCTSKKAKTEKPFRISIDLFTLEVEDGTIRI